MSKWPWPDRLNTMVSALPSALQRRASSMAQRTAWVASGAGTMPSRARELHARLEAGDLVIGAGLDQAEVVDVRHQRPHAVIAQAAGMEAGRNEGRAERVHLDQRRQMRGVAEIIGIFSARQRRAGGRLDGDEAAPAAAAQLQAEEREGQAGEIRAAAGAGDDHVGIVAGHFELLDRFLADDRSGAA